MQLSSASRRKFEFTHDTDQQYRGPKFSSLSLYRPSSRKCLFENFGWDWLFFPIDTLRTMKKYGIVCSARIPSTFRNRATPHRKEFKTHPLFERLKFTLLAIANTFTYQITGLCQLCVLTHAPATNVYQLCTTQCPLGVTADIRRVPSANLPTHFLILHQHIGSSSWVPNCNWRYCG